jgi:hypothetical protein
MNKGVAKEISGDSDLKVYFDALYNLTAATKFFPYLFTSQLGSCSL